MANFLFVKTWRAFMSEKQEATTMINLDQIYMIEKVQTDQYQLFLPNGYSAFINEVECRKILVAVGYGEDRIDQFLERATVY